MYKTTDEINIVSTRTGYIPQLQMCGPIVNPLKVPAQTCLAMVTAGVPLFEFDPKTKQIVALTINNVYDDEKFTLKEAVKQDAGDGTPIRPIKGEAIPAPVVPEKPVVPVSQSPVETAPTVDTSAENNSPAEPEVSENVEPEKTEESIAPAEAVEVPVEENTDQEPDEKTEESALVDPEVPQQPKFPQQKTKKNHR